MWGELPALKTELEDFEQVLKNQFKTARSINNYIDGISLDVIQSGGKRLRPGMVISSAMMGEYDRDKAFSAAISIELLHTATLIHDDIIDEAHLRRSAPALYVAEGTSTAIFTGDYLYVKSILALANAGLPVDYMRDVAKAVEAVCVGEVDQYKGRGTIPGFKAYLSRIVRKTGGLFAASCAIGAHIGGLDVENVKRAAKFGGYYGIAFQIKDDLADIAESQDTIGKPVGSDLKEGIITLPVLLAAAKDAEFRRSLNSFLNGLERKKAPKKDLFSLVRAVTEAGGVKDAQGIQDRYVGKAESALEKLPDKAGRDMLAYILKKTFIN